MIATQSIFVMKALRGRREQQLDGPVLERSYETRFDALRLTY